MKEAGANPVEVDIPGLADLLRDSSAINADFKFDFAEYLAGAENPPVTSIGEILERGLFHASLESSLRSRNAVTSRDTAASRRARQKRAAIRKAVEALLAEQRLVALVYPTLRRKAARLGDAQGPSNCQISAHSGLPALGLPAGFTDDGVPIGMDLLGAAFSEPDLLSLGHAIERTLELRRPPFSTPALVAGLPPALRTATAALSALASADARRPALQAQMRLRYDATTSRLDYTLEIDPGGADRIAAVWIHRGTLDAPGPARLQLVGPGRPADGSVVLSAADRRDLEKGQLLVRFFLRDGFGSAGDVLLSFSR
jgi:hypothetical protein